MLQLNRRQLLRAGSAAAAWPLHAHAARDFEDLVWNDPARRRDLPLRIRVPEGDGPCPVVIFSHGLGGSREGGDAWGSAWRAVGLLVVHVQHPGSDTPALRSGPAAWRDAVSPQQLAARVADVKFVLDEIARRRDQPVWSRARADAIGMSGHSFGAQTTQALAGQRIASQPAELAEPRIKAFIAFSPSLARRDPSTPAEQFGSVTRPMLCITGTLDGDPLGGSSVTPQTRREVYGGLPAGHKAMLVLDGADHMTFGGNDEHRIRFAGLFKRRAALTEEREPAHHALVARITTQWWRAQLLGDRAAADALAQPEGLAEGDVWRRG